MNAKNPKARRPLAQAGFTLVEIMVVIVILGLLATMVATNVMSASDEARIKTAQTSVKAIADAVVMYYTNNGKLPDSLEALTSDEVKGGPYLQELSKDPWENDFLLRGESKKDFEIICMGPDGSENTDDDITSRKKKD
jgi:general secretion pathway protein G